MWVLETVRSREIPVCLFLPICLWTIHLRSLSSWFNSEGLCEIMQWSTLTWHAVNTQQICWVAIVTQCNLYSNASPKDVGSSHCTHTGALEAEKGWGHVGSKWTSKLRAKEDPKQPCPRTELEYNFKWQFHLDYEAGGASQRAEETKPRKTGGMRPKPFRKENMMQRWISGPLVSWKSGKNFSEEVAFDLSLKGWVGAWQEEKLEKGRPWRRNSRDKGIVMSRGKELEYCRPGTLSV